MEKRETTSDLLFQQLSREIIDGHLKSREKLSEPALARRFGTSRAPVREAIRRLEERGLITRKPHSGPRVASFSMEKFLELFAIREVLEGLACKLCVDTMTDRELSVIRQRLEAQLVLIESGTAPAQTREAVMDFHYTLARGGGNAALERLLCDDFRTMITLYRKRYSWIGSVEARARSVREHLRILEALEERDGQFAETLMRRHIAAAMKKMILAYQQNRDQ